VRGKLAQQLKVQTDVAAVLGLSQKAVSRRLIGTVSFSARELHVLADWLGVSPAELIGESRTKLSRSA
jgi:transcriptional regulator with XRE-family HTH domain